MVYETKFCVYCDRMKRFVMRKNGQIDIIGIRAKMAI
jgi:hypothetical protein